ncbi:aminodeoxychorismate lyase [Thioflexithrix psekupsensis]|uniref:Aminodeoxychorismate lyase n=1 Tax=Thioflexithrix psekupsensis TaxID=1570016 RepID=A0A251X517_9GAMM|nr:aminodeoxychorismate lyase [Thioflexithrix psekupsensis]OUD12480.1 aminodeoxychorismate lyase [Thioflexithrix psekupsensis]
MCPVSECVIFDGQSPLSALDRGLHYGDGLFETIAVAEGCPLAWTAHWQRLQQGAARLSLPLPSFAQLDRDIQARSQSLSRGVIKLIVTRGSAGRGYAPPSDPTPTCFLLSYPLPDYPLSHWQRGVIARVGRLRVARQPTLAGIKHLNRLEQVLARQEWQNPLISESILLDSLDYLCEGVMTNLFWVKDKTLFTPNLDQCGVNGIIRQRIIDQANVWGYSVVIGYYPLSALAEAEEIFLTNSIIGLWPVRQLGAWRYALADTARTIQRQLQQDGWSIHYA